MGYHVERRWIVWLLLVVVPACGRRDYRRRADRDAYALLSEKTLNTPWQIPNEFSVYPSRDSRLADPTSPDFPCLPAPGPVLYVRPESPTADEESRSFDEGQPAAEPLSQALRRFPLTQPDFSPAPPAELQWVSFQDETAPPDNGDRLPPPLPDITLEPLPAPVAEPTSPPDPAATSEIGLQPIPRDYWSALPPSCLTHMLEFTSVREEHRRTFAAPAETPPPTDTDATLNLSDLIELARANSREYQTEKERLYVSALAVSLERFDYQLKPSVTGNGVGANYSHDRFNGVTVNTLSVPSSLQVDRMLATGGNFLARFANDVVLTFNGPQGFTADVASELFFELTQSVLQRDILLEPLISSERNLVYAARTFARYRKTFFFDVASQYYGILRTYRSIEINSQNYFSLVRTVEQSQAEVRAAVKNAPNQVAVDQFEQGMLSGRSNLIESCNRLERELDQLKLTLGLPTEYPVRLNLQELERLTLLDETQVSLERVRRWRRRVVEERNQTLIQRADLLNADLFMLERLFEWVSLKEQEQPDASTAGTDELSDLRSLLSFELARNDAARNRLEFDRVSDPAVKQPPILIYLRTTELLDSLLILLDRQVDRWATSPQADQAEVSAARAQHAELMQRLAASRSTLADNSDADQLDRIFADAHQLLLDAEQLSQRLDTLLGYDRTLSERAKDRQAIKVTDRLLDISGNLIASAGASLPAVDIDVSDAMLTALIQRLDMMNERGLLADDWRRVKLASDDLRSVLNLNASHALRTDKNEPFDFDFDDSRTQLRVSLDLPFNRRAQRNRFRQSLINYQAGRRNVMQLEDSIKFDIRNGLRNLELTRVQYPISVTQAALAAEQVISIRLQLALGTPNVRGTDLLDALQGSREALTSVANARIGYLVERSRFVLDLELMQLDENGFWPQINDANYQPTPNLNYPWNAGPTYGELPPGIKPTKLMYHIYGHPLPGEAIELIDVE